MRLGGLGGLAALFATVFAVTPAAGASLAPGFTDKVVLDGATRPTAVRFVNGGSYVAEKDGRILFYKSFGSQPSLVADLSTEVYDAGDHGLLGLAIDPRFPSRPYLYVLYSYDAAIGGTAPRWGVPGVLQDVCPTPPGANIDGCVTSGRLSRLTIKRHSMTSEAVLINDWCNQFTTHSIGDLRFGQDGNLYASGGDGAKVAPSDYGQFGSPVNPCGDPPGGAMSPPGAEGGSLRSQDLQTPNDPVNLDGTLIRINPSTGQGAATNPLASSGDPNARRIVAYGMRNPFRFTIRPGTNDVWIGDVGLNTWEEIDRLPNPTTQPVTNFGWHGARRPVGMPRRERLLQGRQATSSSLHGPPQLFPQMRQQLVAEAARAARAAADDAATPEARLFLTRHANLLEKIASARRRVERRLTRVVPTAAVVESLLETAL